MIRLAVEELCETADSLIAPVRLGVARPTAPFTLASSANDIINGSEELFLVEPLAPQGGRGSVASQSSIRSDTRPLLGSSVVRGAVRDLDDTNDAESEFINMYIVIFSLYLFLIYICSINLAFVSWLNNSYVNVIE